MVQEPTGKVGEGVEANKVIRKVRLRNSDTADAVIPDFSVQVLSRAPWRDPAGTEAPDRTAYFRISIFRVRFFSCET